MNTTAMKEMEKSLDPQLWHACAGSMVQIPPVNSTVYYFPQGHAEHSHAPPLALAVRLPSLILCRVLAVKYLADPETDEVFAKITLLPLDNAAGSRPDSGNSNTSNLAQDKPASFAKTLTQSDANNGGGFSVPRYCAETIFPRLDYAADPPVQTVVAKDIHGDTWKFRHIYRGTPRRHLLTTGWSTFVNQKKLVAGDSIVFLRSDSGELCVGIRRAKRGGIGIAALPERPFLKSLGMGFEAVAREVARGREFEVVYYPRASTPEFCVREESVRSAMRIRWCSGMRFKMAFETEDSSRISWFMGTVSSVQVADPIRWPNSPWRLLQVAWDEPDLLQNVKRVNPWLVELVSNMPSMHLSPFSPRKKLRAPQPFDFPVGDGKLFPMPQSLFLGNTNNTNTLSPMCCLSDNTPAGIQGARHAHFRTSFSDRLRFDNSQLHTGLFLSGFKHLDHSERSVTSSGSITEQTKGSDVSCLLTIGKSDWNPEKAGTNAKKCQFLLFGQPILTEQEITNDPLPHVLTRKRLFEGNQEDLTPKRPSLSEMTSQRSFADIASGLDMGHCKVFLESEDVGRTIDLSGMLSYEELYQKLANMFGIERSDVLRHVLYQDASGGVKQAGDVPFSDFVKTARRLTITMVPGINNVRKTWVTGLQSAENGLDARKKTAGPLSILA